MTSVNSVLVGQAATIAVLLIRDALRGRAERTLRASQDRFHHLADHAPVTTL